MSSVDPNPASRLEYIHPLTPRAPGPLARAMLAPLPRWVWAGLALLTLAPFVAFFGGLLTPTSLYLWPAVGVLGFVYSVFPLLLLFGARALVRGWVVRRYKVARGQAAGEGRRAGLAVAILAVYWSSVATPLPIKLFVAMRLSAFDALRERVATRPTPAGPTIIPPFRISDTELYTGEGEGIVVLYTEGTRGAFPGSGSGFIYVPDGQRLPGYNAGSDGHAWGNWYWFTTD